MPLLKLLTINKYKDLFNFTAEIIDQDSSNFKGSLDIDIFTNIPFEETIEICTIGLFDNRVFLQKMSFGNQYLVVYTPILIAFYLTPAKLV